MIRFDTYTPAEIRRKYWNSKDKEFTFKALVDITCSTPKELADFLGIEPPERKNRPKAKINPDRALELYNQGMNDSRIARELDVTRQAVHDWREANRLPVNKTTHEQRMAVYQKGLSDGKAAKELGIGKSTYREWRHKNGLKINGGNSK